MTLTATQQNWVGGCQIANTVLSTYGGIQNALDQFDLAKATLEGEKKLADMNYKHERDRINREIKAQGKLEEVAKEHNETAVEAAELENAIALVKEERRIENANKKYANDVRHDAYKRALNSRNTFYYGNPIT